MPHDDPNRDEDGEPLMDFDEDIQSDQDEPQHPFQEDEEDAGYDRSQRSPTPVFDSKAKPMKRLKKKSSSGKESGPVDFGFDDDEGDVGGDYGGDEDDMSREKHSDSETREMWDTVMGGDSEKGKKKKKHEKSAEEIALLVENVMAELEVAAEEDAELNLQGKLADQKLKKLSLFKDVLAEKQFQQKFLDHGVFTLLKNWLQKLPDGSVPNRHIRAGVLEIMNDLPIDLNQHYRKEQLEKSGLDQIIFSMSNFEETPSIRKLAKELVEKWGIRFEDMKNIEDERAMRRLPRNKAMSKAPGMSSQDDDLDLTKFSQGTKSGPSSSRQHVKE